MIKKLFILALIIPTVVLTTILFTNIDKIGVKKDIVEKTFIVKGMTSSDCETTFRNSFKDTDVDVLSVSFADQLAVLKYDAAIIDKAFLYKQLNGSGLSIKVKTKDQLKIIDYKVRVN